MNDDPTSDALSRASAYLDGELDASEIAAVEADPAVMAEVDELRALQASIREVPGPSGHARETAVTAALAEFDLRRHPAPVVRSRPRPAYSRWLGVAAAVAGIAVVGAVITTAGRGGNDGDDSAQLAATAEQSSVAFDSAAADRAASAGGAPAVPQPESTQSQSVLSATEAPASLAVAAPGAGDQAAATTAAPATTSAASEASAESGASPFDPTTPIPDAFELGRVGHQLLVEWRDGMRSKMSTPCDVTDTNLVLLSDAVLIVDGASRAVLVAGNPSTDETFALDPDSCVVVMSGASR